MSPLSSSLVIYVTALERHKKELRVFPSRNARKLKSTLLSPSTITIRRRAENMHKNPFRFDLYLSEHRTEFFAETRNKPLKLAQCIYSWKITIDDKNNNKKNMAITSVALFPQRCTRFQCETVHNLSAQYQCDFIINNTECHEDENFVAYTTFVYCAFGSGNVVPPLLVLVRLTFFCIHHHFDFLLK